MYDQVSENIGSLHKYALHGEGSKYKNETFNVAYVYIKNVIQK